MDSKILKYTNVSHKCGYFRLKAAEIESQLT